MLVLVLLKQYWTEPAQEESDRWGSAPERLKRRLQRSVRETGSSEARCGLKS